MLPFQDLSPSGNQEHLAEGMAEELLSVLSRLSGLRVAGRTSSFAFKGRDLPLEAIAGELGVTHILEGSIRTSGQRFRISARLVSAADGFQVWSREFEGSMADVFSVQDQISAGVLMHRAGRLLQRRLSCLRITCRWTLRPTSRRKSA